MTALAAAVALTLAGSPVVAGVGIQAGPVCPATTVAQGGTYTLPPVQVADTGSGDVSISLAVIRMTDRRSVLHGQPVPRGWVAFTYPRKWLVIPQSSVPVASGGSALVPGTLAIPATAATGAYVAWILPYPAGSSTPGRANLGGTGVADLEFTVTRAGTAPRRAVCVTPGAKPASPAKAAALTAHAAAHDPAVKGHLVPAKDRKYVPDVMIGALVLGALVVARRTGWL